MDVLTGVISLTSIPGFLYYGALVIIGIFFSGFYLKNKLATICKDSNKELEDQMNELTERLKEHEKQTITIPEYNKDMLAVRALVGDIKEDVRLGFTALNQRIDALLLSAKSI